MDDRNEIAHANGNIFFSTEAALDIKIQKILHLVDEIQVHSKSVIEKCYREFLLNNHDPEEREYPDSADQIREVLIHNNYMSQKDIECCIAHDLAEPHNRAVCPQIMELHQGLVDGYGDDGPETK